MLQMFHYAQGLVGMAVDMKFGTILSVNMRLLRALEVALVFSSPGP